MIDLRSIAEKAVGLIEKFTPWGAAAAPLINVAKEIFHEAKGGLAEHELAPLQARIAAADADRMKTWKEADDALDAAAKR